MDSFLTPDLTREEREAFEERTAAIRLCGLLTHREAELAAYEEVLRVREARTLLQQSGRSKTVQSGGHDDICVQAQ